MGAKCDAKAGTACDSRRAAMRCGEMYFSHRHGGWIFPADDRSIPRLLREKLLAPYVWTTHCPMCDGTLPDIVSGVQKMFDEPPPEPWKDDGEGAES